MGHHYITEIKEEKFEFTTRSRIFVTAILVLGIILAAIGAMQVSSPAADSTEKHAMAQVDDHGHDHDQTGTDHAASSHDGEAVTGHGSEKASGSNGTARIWANLLLNSYYFLLFGMGALFFWAVNYAANAGWSTLVKRVVEAISSYIIPGALVLLVVIIAGGDHIYHWVQYQKLGLTESDAGYDALLDGKKWFLNKRWLYAGVGIIALLWIAFRFMLRRFSLREDQEGGTKYHIKSIRYSAGFLAFFAFSFSIFSWIVVMSIDAHWFSTIFSVYNFAVTFVTGMAILGLFVIYLKSKGYMEVVSDEVVHDIGKFMFAFSIFWAYIWLAQYLLIWYANLPEETIYYDIRLNNQVFEPLFLTNIVMCFILPFLVLMMRNAKRNPKVMILAASIILVGHWLDMYLMVMPGVLGTAASIGLVEIGTTMAFAGLFIYIVLNTLSKTPLYPKNHPFLLESANHDVGV